MRELSATLLAAQKRPSSVPYVKVEVREKAAEVTRLSWSRLYTGSEADRYHAATMPGDGSLVRARVETFDSVLYRQRVANPGPQSDYSTWWGVCFVSSVSDIALCSRGAMALLCYVGTDQRTIYARESSDYGASFGDAVTVTTAANPVGGMAADIKQDGTVALFYSVGAVVYVVLRSGGLWGTPSAWTNSASAITGLGCTYWGDWNLIVTGQDGNSNGRVWGCIYGDGYSQAPGTWSILREITAAAQGSGVEFRCPTVTTCDVFRTFYVEAYTGTVAYSRPYGTHSLPTASFAANRWREPYPFNENCTYGVALCRSATHVWLTRPSGVWRASLVEPSLNLTPDVLALTLELGPKGEQARIELRNDDGRYNAPGVGALSVLRPGAQLAVGLGYITAAGAETAPELVFGLEAWEHTAQAGSASLLLHGTGIWELLSRWHARRQFSWSAGSRNVFQLMSFVLARVGVEYSILGSSSGTLSNHYPAFAIHPDESGRAAVERLLAMVPDVLFFREGRAHSKNPTADEASVYAFGGDHAIYGGRYIAQAWGSNRAQVYGQGVLGEAFAWDEVERVFDYLRQVHDLNLTTAQDATNRAATELRHQELEVSRGQIWVPSNCGQELYDVIEITDARCGLSGARRRAIGMRLEYLPRQGHYRQRLALGPP